jgi:hypothetical protein
LKRKMYCIVCEKEKKGIELQDDAVLGSLRWFKRNVTKNERGNRLVVCRDCYPSYKISRKKYEDRQRMYVVLGVLFGIVCMVVSPTLTSFLASMLILLLLLFLSILSYTPKISIKTAQS